MTELDFRFDRGGLHFPLLHLWLDAHQAISGPDAVFVSHAHADHTGAHASVVFSPPTQKLMRARVGGTRQETVLEYGRSTQWSDFLPQSSCPQARLTILPAGHILGSGMALIEIGDASLLYSGDFKLRPGFAAQRCVPRKADILVMETTFGRPEYVFPPSEAVWPGIIRFCAEAIDNDETPVLLGYSLGKAQEILMGLKGRGFPVSLAPPVMPMTRIYEGFGYEFPPYQEWKGGPLSGRVLIAPPGLSPSKLRQQLGPSRLAILSGWALHPNACYQYRVDAAFPISDHADFPELVEFVRLVSPRKVYTLHGYAADFADHLRELGLDAQPLSERDQLRLDLPTGSPVRGAKFRVPSASAQPNALEKVPPADDRLIGTFAAFAYACEELRMISGKSEKLAKLTAILAQSPSTEIPILSAWLSGRWLPDEPIPMPRIGAAWFARVVQTVGGISRAQFADIAVLHGHPAETVADIVRRYGPFSAGHQPAPIGLPSVADLAERLRSWPTDRLSGRDVLIWARIFQQTSVIEARWLARVLMGDVRIGLPKTLLEQATNPLRQQVEGQTHAAPPLPSSRNQLLQSCLSLNCS